MQTLTDPQLLRAYAEDHSETAFDELVRRHVDLTYSVALRIVRDAHLAEDVTQAVFVALAQNAGTLSDHPVLSGWLHRAARNVASQMVRSEVRRRAREQEAVSMNEPTSGTDAPWQEVEPHLDSVLAELEPTDRDAVLLRYFERKTAREMADLLGIGAEAAQKRVSRAVEQLRVLFARRGVVVTTGGLAILMTSHAVQASPAGLAAAVSGAATLTTVATATLPAGTLEVAGSTTGSVTLGAAGGALLPKIAAGCAAAMLAGLGVWGVVENRALRLQVRSLEAQVAADRKGNGPSSPRTASTPVPPIAGTGRDSFPADGPSPLASVPSDATPTPTSSAAGETPGASMGGAGRAATGMGSSAGGGSGSSMGSASRTAASGGQALEAETVNGSTVIRYGGREFPVGRTRGLVTTRAVSLQGHEYAAAFEDGRVIWESTPGAAQQLR